MTNKIPKNIEDIADKRLMTPGLKQFRRYKCRECGKRFATIGNARNHVHSLKHLEAKQ
jgi:transcriptional regulator NrdR family protein